MNRFFVCGILLVMAIGTNAAIADSSKQEPAKAASSPNAAQAGMKAYVDPQTGQLISRPPTPAEAAKLDSAFKEDYSKIQEIHKADGSTEWIFNGQVDSALVARVGADGKVEMVCSEHGVVHDHPVAPLSQGGRDER